MSCVCRSCSALHAARTPALPIANELASLCERCLKPLGKRGSTNRFASLVHSRKQSSPTNAKRDSSTHGEQGSTIHGEQG
eukprot:408151-Pleurochrysis_carterae.AAC.1